MGSAALNDLRFDYFWVRGKKPGFWLNLAIKSRIWERNRVFGSLWVSRRFLQKLTNN